MNNSNFWDGFNTLLVESKTNNDSSGDFWNGFDTLPANGVNNVQEEPSWGNRLTSGVKSIASGAVEEVLTPLRWLIIFLLWRRTPKHIETKN